MLGLFGGEGLDGGGELVVERGDALQRLDVAGRRGEGGGGGAQRRVHRHADVVHGRRPVLVVAAVDADRVRDAQRRERGQVREDVRGDVREEDGVFAKDLMVAGVRWRFGVVGERVRACLRRSSQCTVRFSSSS